MEGKLRFEGLSGSFVGSEGSCFPEDARVLDRLALANGHSIELLQSVINRHNRQRLLPHSALRRQFGQPKGLGIASKPDSEDVTTVSLRDKIESREAIVSIIGLGYVGLPLALLFAESGFRVIGIDVNQDRVDAINRGESCIQDVSSKQLTRQTVDTKGQNLRATTDYEALRKADAVIVCVPTPLSKTRDPDVSFIASATDEIAERLHRGMLIVLESTSYPGTTEEIILPRLEQARSGEGNESSFKVGQDFFLAFSPERIDPGRADWSVKNTPKVIGGITASCADAAIALYESAVDQVVPVSSPKVAEMVKLLENTFRATNIALVNEIAIMCGRLEIDVWEVIEAARSKPFGFMAFYPGPGLGGHCIPVDPHYLAWKLKTLQYNARFIQLAEEVNFGMPAYILTKISDALNDNGLPLNGSRLLILGVAYKGDVGDIRESPALDIIQLLSHKGANIAYHDPFVPELSFEDISLVSVELNDKILSDMDCVVVITAHSSYDWDWVVKGSKLVVDTRNATAKVANNRDRIVKL